MDDYIKRKDVIHLLVECDLMGDVDVCRAMQKVREIPAADVVEVVRCKDCEYADFLVDYVPTCICTRIGEHCAKREKDFFCAYGKRRADDDT